LLPQINQAINEPEKFSFTNVTNACLSNVSICDRPNEYLFWDDIHPTTAAHKLLVELAFSALKLAPEPRPVSAPEFTVPLSVMIFGALGAGLILKRKKTMRKRI
jgi:hypothetical protein